MKICLVPASRGPISRETARGCLVSNLAMPGAGSLAAGRCIGYLQMALALAGLGISSVTTVRFVSWYFNHLPEVREPDMETVFAILRELRGPALGLAIFTAGWLWALVTSWQILRSARRETRRPPKLT